VLKALLSDSQNAVLKGAGAILLLRFVVHSHLRLGALAHLLWCLRG
jgi:hypothetical protein